MATLKYKVIRPGKLKVDEYRRQIQQAVRKQGEQAKRDHEQTVTTFRAKPTFKLTVGTTHDGTLFAHIEPAEGEAGKVWQYLDQGTSIRWAVMSRDFEAKTQPQRLTPGPGRGRAVIAGRRAMQERNIPPRPGIKKRGYSRLIRDKNRKPFRKAVVTALFRAARDGWTG